MKSLAALVLVLVFVAHYVPDHLAAGYENAAAAAKAWFYILRGAVGVPLYAIIAALACIIDRRRGWLVALPCAWGMTEEAQTAFCRLGKPIEQVPGHELFTGLCGPEWYWAGLVAAVVIGGFLLDFREKP